MASRRREPRARASASRASPSERAETPVWRARVSRVRRTDSESTPSAAPRSQVTSRTSRPFWAAQVSTATTATPLPISTTRSTPGTARAAVSSYSRTVPPNVGQRATAAKRIPGRRTSSPYTALPSTLPGSVTRRGEVPTRRKSEGLLRGGSSGTGRRAASSTSPPYPRRRPLGSCTMAPRSARHPSTSTSHRRAAASRSISRAAAPAFRRGSHAVRTLLLPPVLTDRGQADGSAGGGATRTRLQSASSSSARIMGSAVRTPCPISPSSTTMVAIPPPSRVSQAFGVNVVTLPSASFPAKRRTPGMEKAMTNPAAAAPVTFTKSRRFITSHLPGPRRAGSPFESADRSRSGRCCPPSTGRSRRRTGPGSRRGAPPPT